MLLNFTSFAARSNGKVRALPTSPRGLTSQSVRIVIAGSSASANRYIERMGRGYVACIVRGCYDKDSTRHRFPNPDKDRKRFDVWLQLVQNPNLLALDPKRVFTNYRVCHQHFTANDKSSNMFIVRTAIPSQKLPPTTGSTASTSEVVKEEEALNTIKTEKLSLPVEVCAALTDNQYSPPRVGDIIKPAELIPKAKHFYKAKNLQKINSVYKLRNGIPFKKDYTHNGRSTQSMNSNYSVEQTTENSTPERSLTLTVPQQQPVITYKNTKRQRLTQLTSTVHLPKGIAETANAQLEENEFEIFGRSIGLELKAMPIQTAVKAQQHIQRYLSTIRLQHMVSNQNRCCQTTSIPPPCSVNDSDVQARTRGSCEVLPPSAASSGIRATLKRPA